MQTNQRPTAAAALPQLDEIRQLVRDSLWGDWIIRVEHTVPASGSGAPWQQWGEALFAVHDPELVIDAIRDCHTRHPWQAIRICAEKVRPQTRMVYAVRHADEQPVLEEQPLPGSMPLPILGEAQAQPLAARVRAVGRTAWGYVALAGALVGSVLMLEVAGN